MYSPQYFDTYPAHPRSSPSYCLALFLPYLYSGSTMGPKNRASWGWALNKRRYTVPAPESCQSKQSRVQHLRREAKGQGRSHELTGQLGNITHLA